MTNFNKEPDFRSIVKHFQFEGQFEHAELINTGHIHNTYALFFTLPRKTIKKYVLQAINTTVFKQPNLMMENILKISSYLQSKILRLGGDPKRETITWVQTIDGEYLFHNEDGSYWRAMLFIDGAQTYLKMPEFHLYFNASQAFGRFLKLLADYPPSDLNITIPDFHNTPKRFQSFIQALERDSHNRAISVREEIDFILQRERETGILIDLAQQGKIPVRVTHNDTKLDNVLLDNETQKGICVIDLDTVMPGLFLYDFGDTVRSAANTGAEDETDLSKVNFCVRIFELLVKGYLSEMRELLTPAEVENLSFGAKLIIYEQAIRFLTDYLNGDIYYRIHHPRHNLDRCRTQIKLIKDFEAHQDEIEGIVQKIIAG